MMQIKSTQKSASPSAYYPALDGYRAIAVLLVFFHHYAAGKSVIFKWGWVGVDFFFVLSGFLITGILYDTQNKPHRYRDFYIRRTLRIFPLYYFVWIILLLAAPFASWQWDWRWSLWPAYLGNYVRFLFHQVSLDQYPLDVIRVGASLQAHFDIPMHVYIGHFWSLCIEEQFYLFWPMIIYTVRRRDTLIKICAAIIVAEPILRWLLTYILSQSLLQKEILYRILPTRLDSLLIGALLALLLRSPVQQSLNRARHALLASSIFLLATYFAFCRLLYGAFTGAASNPVSTFGFTLIDLFGAAVILQCISPQTMTGKLLSFKPLRAFGIISYGFYVYHDLPHDLYHYVALHYIPGHNYWTAVVLGFVGTLALSTLSYALLERPLLRLKDRFTSPGRVEPEYAEDFETV
jgi:peptidoglycan/LPS O-acetylase OafA/YrhL